MTVAVNMICSERGARRLEVDIDATLRSAGGHRVDVELEDISISGFRMLTSVDLKDGELITIGLAGLGMQPAVVVRRMSGRYGCQFINAVSQSYVDRIQFEKPNTITPIVPGAPTSDTRARLPNADNQPPIGRRVIIILGLGIASWALALEITRMLVNIL